MHTKRSQQFVPQTRFLTSFWYAFIYFPLVTSGGSHTPQKVIFVVLRPNSKESHRPSAIFNTPLYRTLHKNLIIIITS